MRMFKSVWAVAMVAALALPMVFHGSVADAAGPTALGRTSWQVFQPATYKSGINLSPAPIHGDTRYYAYADPIPADLASGWQNCGVSLLCPDANTINMHQTSRLPGCWTYADFTYFQSFVSIPENATLTEFTVDMNGADDGARVTIINSHYPSGFVFTGSYIFLGGSQSTTDLKDYVVKGEINRVVITQVDDCASGNNLNYAAISLNGTVVPVQPSADLSLIKAGLLSSNVGDNYTYSLEVRNAGPSSVTGAVVSDPLPPSVKFLSATSGGCVHDGALSGGVVTCSGFGTIPASGYAPFSITVQLLSPGVVSNTASITNTGNVLDANGANNQATATTTVAPPLAPPAPPFTIPGTLPAGGAPICLPPYMDQNLQTQYWWARAAGGGNLNITLIGVGINAAEAGTVSMNVVSPASVSVGSVSLIQPPSGEAAAPPVVVAGPAAGALYRIEVKVTAPPSGPVARHYRVVLSGATLLGTNSPLQPQAEHEDISWKVNVAAGEPLNVSVLPAPEASLNAGTLKLIPPGGGPAAAVVALTASGGSASVASPAAGQWTVAVVNLNGHYLLSKTGGADTGIYVGWNSAGSGSATVTVLDAIGGPNTNPVTVELIGPDGTVTPFPGVTDTFTWPKLETGLYSVRLAGSTDRQQLVVTCDGVALATLQIPNVPPVAIDDVTDTAEDTAVIVPVLGNDGDPDFDLLAITGVTPGAHGSVVANLDGTVTYTPAPNYHGPDTFTYTISDGNGGSDTAQVTVTVTSVNDLPDAIDDPATTDEDVAVTVNVTGNDTDPDGDTLTVSAVTQGANGTVTIVGNQVTYTPAPNWSGTDSFTYTIVDGQGGTDTATVTVTVKPVNDPPVAGDDAATTDEDAAVIISLLGNDSDPDGGVIGVTSVTQGANGTVVNNGDGTVTYTPASNYNGSDTFTYTITDGQGGSATATVTVTVKPVNDPPVAQDDSATTDEDVAVTVPVLTNDSDVDGDSLTVTSVTQGANGSVTVIGGGVQYTPAPNWSGTDSFTYTVSDGHGGTATATVTVTVNSVNDPPVAANDTATTPEETAVTIPVLANDSDPDGGTVATVSATPGANGSVVVNGDGTATYTPALNFNGTDTFTYTITDGQGGSATATVTVTVTPVNDPPVAQADSANTNEDVAVTVNVIANDSDVDGDALTVTAVTQGANGSVSIAGNQVTYTPNANWFGTDSFTYTISDGHGGTATATVTVTVASVNDLPVAVNDSASVNAGFPVTVSVLANDSDSDGGTLSVVSTSTPANGTVVVNANGTVTYTPNAGFSGTDTFTYTVSDGQGGTATATVTITVIPVADASRMTGGGSIETGKGKDAKRSTWGFEIRCDGSQGNLEYQDHTGGNFHLEGITSVFCVDDPAIGPGVPKAGFDTLRLKGVGRWNGTSGYTVEATIVDAGEPGTRDTIAITIKSASGAAVSTLTGTLTGGNHQAHK